MPATVKPLFRPEALTDAMDGFALPATADAGRARLRQWAGLLGTAAGQILKETQVRDEFLYDVFRDLLGYTLLVGTTAGIDFNSGTLSYRKELNKPDRKVAGKFEYNEATQQSLAAFLNSVRTRTPPVASVQ